MTFNFIHKWEKCREQSCYLFLSNHFYQPILGILTLFTLPALACGCSSAQISQEQTVASEIEIIQKTSGAIKYGGSLDILVFNDDKLKRLDSYQKFQSWDSKTIQIASCSGDKIILAIANANKDRFSWTQINSIEAAKEIMSSLENDGLDKPVMSGLLKIRAGKQPCTDKLILHPLSSIVEIRSIRCDFQGLPYAAEKITDTKAYLLNISAECPIAANGPIKPSRLINAGKFNESDLDEVAQSRLFLHRYTQSIGTEWVKDKAELICYPNSSQDESPGSPFTRLVIEGKIGGNTYYWTIPVNKSHDNSEQGIHRNCRYIYDIDIRRKGATTLDTDINSEFIKFKMEIALWEEKNDYGILF